MTTTCQAFNIAIWVPQSFSVALFVAFEKARFEQLAFFRSLVLTICQASDLGIRIAQFEERAFFRSLVRTICCQAQFFGTAVFIAFEQAWFEQRTFFRR